MKRYCTKYWKSLREDMRDLDEDFARHLREIARPSQIAFVQLMQAVGGEIAGIECKKKTQDQWAFILPDVSGDQLWRIQYFDLDGFSGHQCYATLELATEELIRSGYYIPDAGALDRAASHFRWTLGVKRLEIRTLFDRGLIDFREMCEKMLPFRFPTEA